MNQLVDVIETYDDLLARPSFHASLPFHPKSDRRFGSVVAPYRFLDKIHCGIEACHTPHFSGYLITTSDGRETAIGSHCGRKYFGASFEKEKRRIDDEVRRQRRIKQVRSMLDDMSAQLVLVEALERDYRDLREKKDRLMGAIGIGLFSVLKLRAVRGQIDIEKEVPMTNEEAESFFETSNRKRTDGKGWPTKSVFVARIDGMEFLSARFKDMLVTSLITPMRELSKLTTVDIETMKPRDLTRTAKWVGEVPRSVERAQAIVKAGHDFFRSENIEKLVHLGTPLSTLTPMINDLRDEERSAVA